MTQLLESFDHPATAFVLGATGGVGFACTRRLLQTEEAGLVFAAGRDPERHEGLAGLREEVGDRLVLLPLDLADDVSIERAATGVRERAGSLDLVLGCSGVLHNERLQPEKRLASLAGDGLAESFRINATGPMLVLRQLVPLLPRRERSVVGVLSARVGSIGDNRLGGWYGYRASKAALNMLLRTLALELRRTRPECVCVALHPGTVASELSRPFSQRVPAEKLFSPERAAEQIFGVLGGLGPEQSGGFYAWDGAPIPW
jgi:NAD(P)-dependent dehydrogenase (short-subunit alcohol dehydrogenase family)